jgi:N-dimethylarginine dimethylaminohydrolase
VTRTAQSDVGLIKRLLLQHARDAFRSAAFIAEQWQGLNYLGQPDYDRALVEYDAFVARLESFDIELEFMPPLDSTGLDSIYVRDASICCDRGAILCNMGKQQRRAEPAAQSAVFERLGMPIVGRIIEPGTVEGGDAVWLERHCLAVGRSGRTNEAGIDQLQQLLGDCVTDLIVVPLPDLSVPGDVFHLMSIVSPIDSDLALVYPPLLPRAFGTELQDRGYQLVAVPDEEFHTMGCNVLAVAPRRCIMLRGNPVTRAKLESAGAVVFEIDGNEISHKGAGGPTCLTRPLVRQV